MDQLIDKIGTGYCTQIRLLTNEELNHENFSELPGSPILWESALQYVSDNRDLYFETVKPPARPVPPFSPTPNHMSIMNRKKYET